MRLLHFFLQTARGWSRAVRRGFTLIEILVAITILSLMLLMTAQIFGAFSQVFRSATATMQSFDDVRVILFAIRKDLIGAMVRTNTHRELTFESVAPSLVVLPSGRQADAMLAFTVPDEKVRSLKTMSFVTHYAYLWDAIKGRLYRATYDTEVYRDVLEDSSISASESGKDESANVKRLRNLTLSYALGPTWPTSPEFYRAIQAVATEGQEIPILRNVYDFKVKCHEDASGASVAPSWPASRGELPYYVELILGVARDEDVPIFAKAAEDAGGPITDPALLSRLQRFVLTVPMLNRGVVDNRSY